MNKKTMFIFLVIIMCISLIVGCTNIGENKTENNAKITEDDFPNKPVRIVLPYATGGGTDRALRMFKPFFEKALGTQVVIENTPGGGTEIGTTVVARAEADGYTILASNEPDLSWTLAFQSPKGYDDSTMDIMMISQIDPRIVIANKNSKYNTFEDFIQDANANPGKLAISVGQNSGVHAIALYLRKALNLDYKVVPYDGGGQAAAALMGGHVDLAIGDVFSRIDLRDSLKCIGIMGNEVNPLWPEGPPLDEILETYDVKMPTLNRYGIFAVHSDLIKKYPDRYQKILDAFMKASKDPEYLKIIEENNMQDIEVWIPGEDVKDELKTWMEFLKTEVKPLIKEQ